MADSVYKIIEIVGSSETSWEDAAKKAVDTASSSLKDLRIAEVSARHEDRGREDRRLPRAGQGVLQVHGQGV